MQLELNTCNMMPPNDGQLRDGVSQLELLKPVTTGQTTPIIRSKSKQDCISQRELRFCKVAANEIRILWRKRGPAEQLANEQQPRAPIQEQASRFGERYGSRIGMITAIVENIRVAEDDFVAADQVIAERRDGPVPEFVE